MLAVYGRGSKMAVLLSVGKGRRDERLRTPPLPRLMLATYTVKSHAQFVSVVYDTFTWTDSLYTSVTKIITPEFLRIHADGHCLYPPKSSGSNYVYPRL